MQVGVLALQGAVAEQAGVLRRLGVKVVEVRLPADLEEINALIIPGGESTTISKLLAAYSLIQPLRDKINHGLPVMGICAGVILLAKNIVDDLRVESLGLMDIAVRRNAYGRQLDSFEAELEIPVMGGNTFHGVFIRAPIIESTLNGVHVLSRFNGNPVAVQQDRVIGCTFHPELTDDLRVHGYFLNLV